MRLDSAAADAQGLRNQYPAYEADIAGQTHTSLDAPRAISSAGSATQALWPIWCMASVRNSMRRSGRSRPSCRCGLRLDFGTVCKR
jgi:hypothetical protein